MSASSPISDREAISRAMKAAGINMDNAEAVAWVRKILLLHRHAEFPDVFRSLRKHQPQWFTT
jgi:hypothetical protein